MDRVLLSLATVLLGSSFVVPRRRVAAALGAVGIGLFLYVGVRALWSSDTTRPRYELTSARDVSGGQWFKVKAAKESGKRPVECACTVTSFSGELRWRLSERALLQREDAWGPAEIIMKWPDDFKGPRTAPPGSYEIECSALAIDEDGSVVQIPPLDLEFDH